MSIWRKVKDGLFARHPRKRRRRKGPHVVNTPATKLPAAWRDLPELQDDMSRMAGEER